MSDNLPFDFVIYYNNKGTVHKYNEDEIDIMICCDLHNIYIFPECDVANRNSIREEPPANN